MGREYTGANCLERIRDREILFARLEARSHAHRNENTRGGDHAPRERARSRPGGPAGVARWNSQGFGLLSLRSRKEAEDPGLARFPAGLLLRLRYPVFGKRPSRAGPDDRRGRQGGRHRGGHRRHRPDAFEDRRDPRDAASQVGEDLRPPAEGDPRQRRRPRRLPRLSDRRRLRGGLRAGPRRGVPQPPLHRRPRAGRSVGMKFVSTTSAPKAIGPYSQAVVDSGLLFSSGQVPLDPATGRLVEGGIEASAERVLDNLEAVLREAGLSFADVVKTTVYLTRA